MMRAILALIDEHGSELFFRGIAAVICWRTDLKSQASVDAVARLIKDISLTQEEWIKGHQQKAGQS